MLSVKLHNFFHLLDSILLNQHQISTTKKLLDNSHTLQQTAKVITRKTNEVT